MNAEVKLRGYYDGLNNPAIRSELRLLEKRVLAAAREWRGDPVAFMAHIKLANAVEELLAFEKRHGR